MHYLDSFTHVITVNNLTDDQFRAIRTLNLAIDMNIVDGKEVYHFKGTWIAIHNIITYINTGRFLIEPKSFDETDEYKYWRLVG